MGRCVRVALTCFLVAILGERSGGSCQQDGVQEVLYEVEHCEAPLQSRAFVSRGLVIATACLDAAAGVPVRAQRPPPRPAPPARLAPAPRDAGDGDEMTMRLGELYRRAHRFNMRRRSVSQTADLRFTTVDLLDDLYFAANETIDSLANKAIVWNEIATGELGLVQRDVAALVAGGGAWRVTAGRHGAASVRAGRRGGRAELALGGGRLPVPKYVWTVVQEAAARGRALALVVLNDPFATAAERRAWRACGGACGAAWLRALAAAGARGERVCCCHAHALAAAFPELPAALVADVPAGDAGMLEFVPPVKALTSD